jgi:hypothetical protein
MSMAVAIERGDGATDHDGRADGRCDGMAGDERARVIRAGFNSRAAGQIDKDQRKDRARSAPRRRRRRRELGPHALQLYCATSQ